MAKAPANLIAYAQALLGWPITVDSRVLTTTDQTGGDNDDIERTVKAGAKAKVIGITWHSGDHRLAVTIEIDVPEKDLDGDPNSITASFDEADGSNLFPFRADPGPFEYRNFDVNVRAISHLTKTVQVSAISENDALDRARELAQGDDFDWEQSGAEDVEVEGFA